MTSLLNVIICVSIFLLPVCANAGDWTTWGEISEIYVHGNWTMVHAEGVNDNPDNCNSTVYYAINPTSTNYNAIHASLLSAFMAKKKVRFWVNSCGGQSNNYPHISSVQISN